MSLTWTDVSLDQNNFTVTGGEYQVITLDTFSYALSGNTIFLNVKVNSSTLSSDLSNEIRVTIPNSRRVANRNSEFLYFNSNDNENNIGLLSTTVGNSFVSLFPTLSKSIYWRIGTVTFSFLAIFETEVI